jgi:acetyl-CoA acyltransferase
MAIAEFSTGESMGQSCERLAKRIGISRQDQDEYALASHLRAAQATDKGWLARQIVPARVPPRCHPVTSDNGVRGDSTLSKLGKLKPAFDRRHGSVTAGNSSYLTDGAAAVLLMSESAAERLGMEPIAALRGAAAAGLDPLEELLLGPALTIPKVLDATGLGLEQIETVELHEAFAAQVLAVLELLEDETFCRQRLDRDQALGGIDRERINAWGGSLSVGHPFGATGARLITTCCHRMQAEKSRYGLVAACAAGALGIGLVLEQP